MQTILYLYILSLSGELPTAHEMLFEYFWDIEQKKWIPWTKLVPKYVHAPEKKCNDILVPTVDTVRTTWILNLMVRIKQPVVLIGETGTSKTATIANFLRTLDQESHVSRESLLWTSFVLGEMIKRVVMSIGHVSLVKSPDEILQEPALLFEILQQFYQNG